MTAILATDPSTVEGLLAAVDHEWGGVLMPLPDGATAPEPGPLAIVTIGIIVATADADYIPVVPFVRDQRSTVRSIELRGSDVGGGMHLCEPDGEVLNLPYVAGRWATATTGMYLTNLATTGSVSCPICSGTGLVLRPDLHHTMGWCLTCRNDGVINLPHPYIDIAEPGFSTVDTMEYPLSTKET